MLIDLQRFVLKLDNWTTLVPTTYQLNPQQEDPSKQPIPCDSQVRGVLWVCWVPPFSWQLRSWVAKLPWTWLLLCIHQLPHHCSLLFLLSTITIPPSLCLLLLLLQLLLLLLLLSSILLLLLLLLLFILVVFVFLLRLVVVVTDFGSGLGFTPQPVLVVVVVVVVAALGVLSLQHPWLVFAGVCG